MRTSNPTLTASTFQPGLAIGDQRMTIQGTVNKSAILLALVCIPALWVWQKLMTGRGGEAFGWMIGGALVGVVVCLVTCFKKEWSPFTAPVYAVCEGLFIGGISAMYETQLHGIVLQAAMLTFGTLFALLAAYRSGWIRATEKFKLGVTAATGGVALLYLVSWILGMFGVNLSFMYSSSPLSIGISAVIVVIAALNLVLDFDLIEEGAAVGAPKFMEWYGAFALLVTLVWLYLEILRLLAKLNSRRD
jgi:uncharacterized YccA/Bax inhibitor family protein